MNGPRVLYICGSINQTTQLHAVARAMGEHDAVFTPYYAGWSTTAMRKLGMIEMTIGGNKRRAICLAYLTKNGLRIDLDGKRGGYDLVVTSSDIAVPPIPQRIPFVGVQEGILDPERFVAWLIRRLPFLPRWGAGTAFTGESGRCARYCVASEGYREQFIARGIDPTTVVTTGIPNFDDCKRYELNDFSHRGYVLAATSDTRETLKLTDSRTAFIRKVLRIADGRRIIFKLHPNENEASARAEILRLAPEALVFHRGSAEEMVANCSVLVTQWSSVSFVGIALGKEVHSNFSDEELRKLCPIQNGGVSADNIARVCKEQLGLRS